MPRAERPPNMKRDQSALYVSNSVAHPAPSRKRGPGRPPKRMRRLEPIGSICPGDQTGPRIESLLQEYSRSCSVQSHVKWVRLLANCCAREGCFVTHCASRGAFAMSHGAKTLVNCITMFLAYHVPRWCALASDDEWRELLVALRSFHLHCVRRRYIDEDPVLMAALYKLRRFNMREIPRRISALARENFWDSLETVTTTVLSLIDDSDDDEFDDNAGNGYDGGGSGGAGGGASGASDDAMTTGSSSERRSAQKYERFFGDETPLLVDKTEPDGWLLRCEDVNDDNPIQESTVFLRLPPDAAKLGMNSMALSGLQLALRNGVWRPIERDGVFIARAYPPDEVFYY